MKCKKGVFGVYRGCYLAFTIILILSMFKTNKQPSKIYTVLIYAMIKFFYIRPVEKT